ncbi:MAG: YceI family protein [Rhodocyclaceae bacterium]
MIKRVFRPLALAASASLLLTSGVFAAGYGEVDAAASRLTFGFTQMGVNMNGSFGEFEVRLDFDPDKPAAASAGLTLNLASIDTGSVEANEEVLGKDWFDTANHPLARFESREVRVLGDNRFEAVGDLSIKGNSREVAAPFTVTPQGDAMVFEGSFKMNRADFGVGEGMWGDFGIVANEVEVRFHVVAAPSKN